MTSDQNSGSQGAGRPPPSSGNRARPRPDQGDLWSDPPATTPETPAPSPTPPSSPPATPPTPPVAPRVARETPSPASAEEPDDLYEDEDVEVAQPTSLLQAPLGTAGAAGVRRRTTTSRAAPPPVGPAYEEDEYYDDEPEYYETSGSMMMNPFVLAAGAVIAAILLAVFVVFFFGQGGDGPSAVVDGTRTATPSGTPNNGPVFVGLQARSLSTATVREGPGPSFLELGLLRARQAVDVTGRNEDATWFQIVFPANSNLRGWVPATALQLPDNVLDVVALADFTPVPRPEIEDPTPVPIATDEPIPEDTATPEPGQFADIAVFITSDCTAGSNIVIQVMNVGTIGLDSEPIRIIVANNGIVVYDQAFEADMEPGASVPLNTGVPAQPTTMMVTVLLQAQNDVNASNNAASCTVQGGGGNVPPPIGGDDEDEDDEE